MARLEPQPFSAHMTTTPNGADAPDLKPTPRYCGLCGQATSRGDEAIDRFGEAFCSDAHADEFVRSVRAARIQAAATVETTFEGTGNTAPGADSQRDWKAIVGKALCWGAPLLVVALVLAGGTGALVGWAGAALPFLAVLACPLGMYLMMRGMSRMGDHGHSKGKPEGR